MKTTTSLYFKFETSNTTAMMNQMVQLNKCYVKWSTKPFRKHKAMLHNGIHINETTLMQFAKTNTKLTTKSTRLQVSIQFISDDLCPFSLWPFGLWPFWFMAVSVCGPFGLWPFRFVAISVFDRFGLAVSVCGRYDQKPHRQWLTATYRRLALSQIDTYLCFLFGRDCTINVIDCTIFFPKHLRTCHKYQ